LKHLRCTSSVFSDMRIRKLESAQFLKIPLTKLILQRKVWTRSLQKVITNKVMTIGNKNAYLN